MDFCNEFKKEDGGGREEGDEGGKGEQGLGEGIKRDKDSGKGRGGTRRRIMEGGRISEEGGGERN